MGEQIVLNLNLKFLLQALSLEQRGEIFTALFEGAYQGNDTVVKNVYQYMDTLNNENSAMRQKMRELSAKGVAARLKKSKQTNQSVDRPDNHSLEERKVAKESSNILNIFSQQLHCKNADMLRGSFSPPQLEEVEAFVVKEKLWVNAANFVDFYNKRQWMVGKVPMRSWQSVIRLWHKRACNAHYGDSQDRPEDEKYWQEMAERVNEISPNTDILAVKKTLSAQQNLPSSLEAEDSNIDLTLQPFTRFMKRVEKYDINSENNDEQK